MARSRYACIRELLLPVNINYASEDQLSFLLQGDTYLARKIKRRTNYVDPAEVLSQEIIPANVYEFIKEKITTEPAHKKIESLASEERECIKDEPWIAGFERRPMRWREISEQSEDFRNAVLDAVEGAGGTVGMKEQDRLSWWPTFLFLRTRDKKHEAVLERLLGTQSLEIFVGAQLEADGPYADLLRSPKARQDFIDAIAERTSTKGHTAVYFIWNEDVFIHPEMNEVKEQLRRKLSPVELITLIGSPHEVAKTINDSQVDVP